MCPDDILINNYIDGLLSIEQIETLEAHLFDCISCTNKFNALSIYATSMKVIKNTEIHDEISDSFLDGIFAKIDAIEHPSFEQISSYYDGQENLVSYNKIKDHLEECTPCENILNNIQNQANIVSILPEYEADDSFMASLFGKIDQLETVEEKHITFEDLSAFADGELDNIDKQHLDECSICNDNYQSILNTQKMVASLRTPVLPIDFATRVIEKIDQNEEKIVPFRRQREGIFSKASIVAGLIVFGILVPMSRTLVIDKESGTIITASIDKNAHTISVRSEDLLFSSSEEFKKDSFEIISETRKSDTAIEIEDIGL